MILAVSTDEGTLSRVLQFTAESVNTRIAA